ncbi:MAG: hypothetical protein QXO25_03320 [Candidatus Bathyarchaeia archaeon]
MSFIEGSLERDGVTFHVKVLPLENAVVAFFYEGEMKLGTVAFSMPIGFGEATGRSSVLLGGKFLVASRALSERLAARYRKMSLVSFHSSLPEAEAFRIYMKLLEDQLRQTS